ncbi:MAG: hypothetical protein J6B85_10820 [Lachnospiraceae bacterium]|nr:hypothetical protein [Lachnospiraceae bacterium]
MYFGDNVKKKHRRIMHQIEHGRFVSGIFCITFASNEANLFDILEAKELLFPYYKKRDVHIVGLAKGRDEACLLVRDMIDEIYQETGGFDVRKYFSNKQ